jgi:hypothetical protein
VSDLLRKVAEERVAQHAGKASSRYMNADSHYIGLKGEAAFAKEFELQVDLTMRNTGDGGIDFTLGGRTIDVKTSTYGDKLRIPVTTEYWCDIYVLAKYDSYHDEAYPVGWADKDAVRAAAIHNFGYGDNHVIDVGYLRPLEELYDLLHPKPIPFPKAEPEPVTPTTLDLTEARLARNTFQYAIEAGKPDQATRILATRYLPALRDLVVGTDPAHITAALDTLAARLLTGSTMTDDPPQRDDKGRLHYTYVHAGAEADDLFDDLLAEYALIYLAWSMRFEGTPKHPTSILMAEIERQCGHVA